MNNKNLMIGLIFLVVVAAVGWRLTRQAPVAPLPDTQEMPPTEAMQKPSPTVAAMMQKESTATSEATDATIAEVKTVNMEAGSFYYKPNTITVKEGTKVKIVFTSVSMMHNFYIDEFNVKSPTVKSGNTETFEFVASKKGTYEYYCAVGSHRANGQVGTLIVE